MLSRCLPLATSHLTVTRASMPAGKRRDQQAITPAFGPYGTAGNDASSSEPLLT